MQEPTRLFEMPKFGEGDLLFTLKDIAYTPATPRMNEPFTVKGKIQLFKIPFIGPIWVIVTVTYPETWWEEIIPIWGSPERREDTTALGGNFEVTYAKGFDREGVYKLAVRAYAGPTIPLDSLTLPPFPPISTEETTFTVTGEVPPVKEAFDILEVTVNERTTSNKVTEKDFDFNTPVLMTTADKLNINFKFQWTGIAKKVTMSVRAGHKGILPWDFVESTSYYSVTVDLPEASELAPFTGSLAQPIVVPLTKCGGLSDGAIEIKVDDYIGRVWNVYATKVAVSDIRWDEKYVGIVKGTYDIGDSVPYSIDYEYKGIAQDGQLTISLGTGPIGTFYEKYKFSPVAVPFDAAMDWEPRRLEGSFVVPDTLERGQVYTVQMTLETLQDKTQETDRDWSALTIPGPPRPDIGPLDRFEVVKGTYNLGDTVNWVLPYTYKGKAQGGRLTISLGTGPIGTFFTKYTFPPIAWQFKEAMDWTEFYEEGYITLPTTLERGQLYSVRANLKPDEGDPEEDTDWSAIRISEEYKGTISKKQLEYDETRGTIPVSNVPQGKRGLVHIWGRNDTTTTQRMGIWWQVKNPAGAVVETHSEWELLPYTGAGSTHEFIGGRFTLDKAGTYTIDAALYMNYDNPTIVDRYTGTLCTVAAVAPPEEYTLTTSASPSGAGYVVKEPDKAKYTAGERVKIWAEVYTSEYAFDHWGGDASGTLSPTTITMDRNKSVIAYFKKVTPPPKEYSLSVDVSPAVGYVTVVPSQFTYKEGDSATLTAYLYSQYAPYYYLDHWTVNGVARVGNPISIVFNENKVVVAVFIWSGAF